MSWFNHHLDDTVDGSEIPRPTTWDVLYKTLQRMGFQLPFPQLVSEGILPKFLHPTWRLGCFLLSHGCYGTFWEDSKAETESTLEGSAQP